MLIVFAISTLLLAGVASKNASIEVQDKTRQAIGAGFLLEKNAEYRTKRISELSEKIGEKDGEFCLLYTSARQAQRKADGSATTGATRPHERPATTELQG